MESYTLAEIVGGVVGGLLFFYKLVKYMKNSSCVLKTGKGSLKFSFETENNSQETA